MNSEANPVNDAAQSGIGGEPAADAPISSVLPPPTRTPMYEASNATRYQRQALIKRIQAQTNRRLVCYVSDNAASIDRDDTLGVVDLLHNLVPGENLDLLLHTGGGDIDAAEKLSTMIRYTVGFGHLRVIVPDFAKSAGTLVALGADCILMSDSSELGPIDPQVVLNDGHGNFIAHSVQSYLDAFETHVTALAKHPNDIAAQIMLGKLDPTRVELFRSVLNRAKSLAEKQLKEWMFREKPGNYTKIAEALIDTKRWLSHGQMISYQDALDMQLSVEYAHPRSDDWRLFWQLYCLQRLAVENRQKLFESDYASLTLDS